MTMCSYCGADDRLERYSIGVHGQCEYDALEARIKHLEAVLNDVAHNSRKKGLHAEAAWIYAALNGSQSTSASEPK